MARIVFPDDGSEQWLQWTDVALAVHLLDEQVGGGSGDVLEIGVWKGAWTSSVLASVPTSRVVGVDPYPEGARAVRSMMLDRLAGLGLADRFTLVGTTEDVDPGLRFDLIHIDGDHSETSAWHDLDFAVSRLAPGGVIVVDDVSHKWLPGVASATYRFLEHSGFRMFAISRVKAYIADPGTAAALHGALQGTLAGVPELRVARTYAELSGHPYPESPDILGQPVLLIEGPKDDPNSQSGAALRSRRSLRGVRRPIGRFLRSRRTGD